MTTQLAAENTHFLPFNKGHNHGAGNPISNNQKYRTSYLWLEVLQKDSRDEWRGLPKNKLQILCENVKYDRKSLPLPILSNS